jgi:transcriptional regulator with XRE-family HTH domain
MTQRLELPNRVGEFRRARGLTVPQLAHKTRLVEGTILTYESAVPATPSLPVALRLAQALGTTVDVLFPTAGALP